MLPLLILGGAVALVLSCLEKEPAENNSQPQKAKKRKKNKSVEIPSSDIDDSANTVPVSAPTSHANSVPDDKQTPAE
jgi:predicted secreted protein